jgi:glycosyltransferase involved in cell wall biosynthesis
VAAAQLVIAPLQIARGIQNKVLEALAMAKPVVASPQAFAGLAARAGEHLLCARTESEWIQNIERLWNDAGLRAQLGAAGREFVLAHHSWNTCLEPLAELLRLVPTPELVAGGMQS